jgi:hypothetical protein
MVWWFCYVGGGSVIKKHVFIYDVGEQLMANLMFYADGAFSLGSLAVLLRELG